MRTHKYTFPPLPLMLELAGLYFAHVNKYLPLLHRPTFERNVREGLYLRCALCPHAAPRRAHRPQERQLRRDRATRVRGCLAVVR